MTKTLKIFCLIFTLFLSSCSKDEENLSNGKVINGDKEYDLNYAYLRYTDRDLGIFQLHLSNDKITFVDGQRIFSDNAKITIDLAVYNDKNSNQDISNYYRVANKENGQSNFELPYLAAATLHFDLKRYGENWESNESYYFWSDGFMDIEENNENGYILDFKFIEGDRIVTGHFNGIIQIVEY